MEVLSNHGVKIQVDVLSHPLPPETSLDLFSGSEHDYLEYGVPLYRASLEGDWKTASSILQERKDLTCARISKRQETALHIAAAARRNQFVKELVKIMKAEDLALKNIKDNTALCFAAASGTVEIAEVMVEKNPNLPLIRGNNGMTPLLMATLLGHREMVWYLMSVTDFDQLNSVDHFELFITAINSDLYDVALKILEEFPDLAEAKDADGQTALHVLAQKYLKPSSAEKGSWTERISTCCNFQAFKNRSLMHDHGLELVRKLWGQIIKKSYKEISLSFGSPARLLFDAAEAGNIEFIAILIDAYPDLIWKVNDQDLSIFHIAIMNRQVGVFNLIYEIGAIKDLLATYTDKKGNNMLHLAAMSPPTGSLDSISGAALKMQRELLWYKEVENVVQPQFRESKNLGGKKPLSLFTENHEKLRKEGEEWMKTTASSCSVVAALIATVVFTAAFTVPGGNDQSKGIPIFQHKIIFVVFAISDALSLVSTSAAVLMFLGILTSRYAQEDFLRSLPLKLMVGLSSLFISIATMMAAFSSAFFLIFKGEIAWISVPVVVALLAAIPVILFAFQQFPLLADIYRSTYHARYLFRPREHKIFNKNKGVPFLKRLVLKCLGKDH